MDPLMCENKQYIVRVKKKDRLIADDQSVFRWSIPLHTCRCVGPERILNNKRNKFHTFTDPLMGDVLTMKSIKNCSLLISTYNWPEALNLCLKSVMR